MSTLVFLTPIMVPKEKIKSNLGDIEKHTGPPSDRGLYLHFHIKAAGSQQRLVQVVPSVRGSQHNDALVLVEAVHLGEQLVDGLVGVGMQHRV